MTPLELLARVAAILPPPRFPLVRFHGVLAPRSSWRKEIVPQPRAPTPCTAANQKASDGKSPDVKVRAMERPPASVHGSHSKHSPVPPMPIVPGARTADTQPPATGCSASRGFALGALGALAPILLAPSILAVAHWSRLMGGLLYAASPRLPWSQLFRRTFATDVEQCPKCHGRLRLVQSITEPAVAYAILERLGIPTDAPTAARARDPTDDDARDYCDG